MGKLWNNDDIEYLIENYSKTNNAELAEYFKRSNIGVQIKAERLGLRKDFYWNQDKFADFVREKTGNEYIVLGTFTAVGNKILLFHTVCGKTWNIQAASFIYGGNRCWHCSRSRSITHEEFSNRVMLINPNIEILDKYFNIKKKLLCRCRLDGYEWLALPETLLKTAKCPQCSNRKYRTKKDFINDLKKVNPKIVLIGEYINSSTKVKMKCLIDNYEWTTDPRTLLFGNGCPRCGGVSKYSPDEFREKMLKINPEIFVIGDYINHYTRIKVNCSNDGNIWMASPHTLINGTGCPCCSSSKGEKRCLSVLNNFGVNFIGQYGFDDLRSELGFQLRFDFAVKDENEEIYCLIEIDGEGHTKPVKFSGMSDSDAIKNFNKIKSHDNLKNVYCKNNNILLIRIPYKFKTIDNIDKILEKELFSLLRKEV